MNNNTTTLDVLWKGIVAPCLSIDWPGGQCPAAEYHSLRKDLQRIIDNESITLENAMQTIAERQARRKA